MLKKNDFQRAVTLYSLEAIWTNALVNLPWKTEKEFADHKNALKAALNAYKKTRK